MRGPRPDRRRLPRLPPPLSPTPFHPTVTLSRPTGPRDDLTMLATAATAATFWVRASAPVVRTPAMARDAPGGAAMVERGGRGRGVESVSPGSLRPAVSFPRPPRSFLLRPIRAAPRTPRAGLWRGARRATEEERGSRDGRERMAPPPPPPAGAGDSGRRRPPSLDIPATDGEGDPPPPSRGTPASASSVVAAALASVVDPIRRAAAAMTPTMMRSGAGGRPTPSVDPIARATMAGARARRATLTMEEVDAIMHKMGGVGGGEGGATPPPPSKDRPRLVPLGPAARRPPSATNAVKTSKYNALTFLPRFLFEMFSRAAYSYFLLQAVLSWIPVVSPFGGLGSTAALAFVLAVAAVKALFEDVNRHRQDAATNASIAHLARADGSVVDIPWRDVRVGHVLRVTDGELFPADLVCLHSSLGDGVCFIKTTNLDGESNLKVRRPVDLRDDAPASEADALALAGLLTVEPPNADLHHFKGRLALAGGGGEAGGDPAPTATPAAPLPPSSPTTAAATIPSRVVPVTINEVLLRGCTLKNTGAVLGVVVYTGADTRIQRNAAATPSKTGSYDHFMNFQIVFVMALQLALCLVSAGAGAGWRAAEGYRRPHLAASDPSQGNPRSPAAYAGILTVTFWILYSYLVPISLFVTMELVKFWQGFVYVNRDAAMVDPATGDGALARNTGLNEDLGKVDYIFSDKTDTLTANEMLLRQVDVGGVVYGDPGFRLEEWTGGEGDACARAWDPRAAAAAAALTADHGWRAMVAASGGEGGGSSGAASPPSGASGASASDASDASLAVVGARMVDFWTTVCVCHSLIVEPSPGGGPPLYQGPSPDEVALVSAARSLGVAFVARRAGGVDLVVHGARLAYEVLAVLDYSSARARMSVVARCPDGAVRLFCKGADAKVMAMLDEGTPAEAREAAETNLAAFARRGLRTLALGTKTIPPSIWADWDERHAAAGALLDGRDEAVAALAGELEGGLTLVGVTAIEDKLQDGVPDAIATLLAAGIKVWVITGDKKETAANIAVSCRLLTDAATALTLDADSPAAADAELTALTAALDARGAGAKGELVVDGPTLAHILETPLEPRLAALGARCAAVVVCRSSPSQKAGIVRMMREFEMAAAGASAKNPLTRWYRRQMRKQAGRMLSVGDGANDVAMIQAADVGVGVIGKEGRQAVNSADFAVSQFRFLVRLLLVHGSLSAYRLSRCEEEREKWEKGNARARRGRRPHPPPPSSLIKYSFYKNVAFGVVLFLYQFYCGFSGQALVDDVSAAAYNVVFTALPIMAFAVLDRPVADLDALVKYPGTYHPKSSLTTASFWKNGVGLAAVDAVAAFFIPLAGAAATRGRDATLDVASLGKTVFVALLGCVTLEVALVARFWTPLFAAALAFSWACVFPFQLGLQLVYAADSAQAGVASALFGDPRFWLVCVLTAALTFGHRFAVRGGIARFRPHDVMILQEVTAREREEKKGRGGGAGGAAAALPTLDGSSRRGLPPGPGVPDAASFKSMGAAADGAAGAAA